MGRTRAVLKAVLPPIVLQGLRKLRSPKGPPVEPPTGALPPFVSESLGTYAQYGEDLVVDAVLGCPLNGYYLEVGANDPSLLSNTRRFYDRGWHGISIEPDPRMYARLAAARSRDTVLNIGVASTNGIASFYRLDPDTLSTFDQSECQRTLREIPGTRLVDVLEVEVATLDSICRSHLQNGQTIDFLSVDVEGTDLDVLKGNDWRSTRPTVVLVEINRAGTEILEFMTGVDYDYLWCNGTNAIFRARALDGAKVPEK
jgi:FkbM family methyltransferase